MAEKKLKRRNDGMALRTYLRSLPVCESPEMAKKLADECKVPIYTFNNWRSGLVRIPELAKDKMEEVTGVLIFNRDENGTEEH
jgi:hypothetical protein